jgi:hypothetical protein
MNDLLGNHIELRHRIPRSVVGQWNPVRWNALVVLRGQRWRLGRKFVLIQSEEVFWAYESCYKDKPQRNCA